MWGYMRGEYCCNSSSTSPNIDYLYCSKYKIPAHQNGHVYLTSHRICYVDNDDPRKNSVAIELRDVDRYEFYVRNEGIYGL